MTLNVKNSGRSTGFFFGAALIVFSGILIFSYSQSISSVESLLRQQIEDVAREAEGSISRAFPIIDHETKLLSRNRALKSLYAHREDGPDDHSEVADFVNWFRQNAETTYMTIGYLSSTGRLLHHADQDMTGQSAGLPIVDRTNSNILERARATVASSGNELSVRVDSTQAGEQVVFLSRAINMRGLTGTVVAAVPLEEVLPVRLTEHMTLAIHERSTGRLIYQSDSKLLRAKRALIEEVGDALDDQRILTIRAEMDEPPWSVAVYMNAEPYLKKPRRAGRLTLLVSLGFVLISGSIIRSLLKRIERRSADLAQANAEIEERNHSLEEAQKIVQAHNEMLEAELATASSMQMKLMPDESPTLPGFSISGHCRPATQVGGDFFQYYPRPDGRLSVAMADVTGHGMEAAIPTVLFSGMLDNQMENTFPPEDLFGRLNRSLVRNLDRRTFVCFSLGELDPLTRRMRLVNGGCPYPYHYQAATGKTRELTLGALPLGLRAECEYDGLDCQLDVGDRVVFCSDGIIEAMDDDGQLFGFERTQDTVNRLSLEGLPATQMIEELLREVDAFRGDAEQQDDQTILVVEVT